MEVDLLFQKGNSMDINKEEDRWEHILNQLCKKIDADQMSIPDPAVLTAALRGLFPAYDIPSGTGIAISNRSKANPYVDVGTEVIPLNRPDVRQYRRRLSALLIG